MRIVLNMGVRSLVLPGGDKDFVEVSVDKETYIPDDHRFLNQFLSSDLETIYDYVDKAALNQSKKDAIIAKDMLKDVHPFFCQNDGISDMYINRSLAHRIWNNESIKDPKSALDAIGIDDASFQDGVVWTGLKDMRGTIDSLFLTKVHLQQRISLLLDDTNEDLAKLPFVLRSGLYSLVASDMKERPVIFETTSRTVLSYPESMRSHKAAMDFDEDFYISVESATQKLHTMNIGLPDVIKAIVSGIDLNDVEDSFVEYDTEWLEDVLNLEVDMMITGNVRLRRCAECGRYFESTGPDDIYCDIRDANGSSCALRHKKKMLADAMRKIYNRTYRTHYARVKAGKESKEYLDNWREDAKRLQGKVLDFEIGLDEYEALLME